jgi:serine/threonine protein kinase
LILEYVDNGSLHDIIFKFGPLPECLVQFYAKQILNALCYLHIKGIIHRDIKGSNILITKNGECKLADFGTCLTGQHEIESHQFSLLGSPYWS